MADNSTVPAEATSSTTPTINDGSSTAASKQLRCSEPDLDVVVGVGDNQQVFHCHSVLLASYSEYVDTMISTPMKEQSSRLITFPDITPETWVNMMALLEPGGALVMSKRARELKELIHFYDKYGFHSGVDVYDEFCYRILSRDPLDWGLDHDGMVDTVMTAYEYNLPRSKPKAIELVFPELFETVCGRLNEDQIRRLVPLIMTSERTLKYIEMVMMGTNGQADYATIRKMVEEASFPEDFSIRRSAIDEQASIAQRFIIKQNIIIHAAGSDVAVGVYRRYHDGPYNIGVMGSCSFANDRVLNVSVILASADPFGNKWEIYAVDSIEGLHDGGERRVLYRWETDHSSVVPPKKGWSVAEHGSEPAPVLDYRFAH